MTRRRLHDPLITMHGPSRTLPLLAILLILASMVLVYLIFLRPPEKLLGTPIAPNSYYHYIEDTARRPQHRTSPPPAPATNSAPAPASTPPPAEAHD